MCRSFSGIREKTKGDTTGSVLDCGCGTGLVGELLKKDTAYKQIVGVDYTQEMLDVCLKKI
eukprot:UN10314